MILNWARNLDAAINQITKTYEWRIGQWSALSTALVTAVLGFISAVAVASITEGLQHITGWKVVFIVLGLVMLILSYVISWQMVHRIKEEYSQLYGLLQVLKSKLN